MRVEVSLRTGGGAFASLNSGVAGYKVFELQQIDFCVPQCLYL